MSWNVPKTSKPYFCISLNATGPGFDVLLLICTYRRSTQRTNYFFLCTFKGTRIIFAQAISIPLYRFANFVLGIRASETMKWSLHFPRHCKRMQFAIFKKTLLIWSFSGLHSCCTPVWIDQEPFVEMLHSDNSMVWVDLRLTFEPNLLFDVVQLFCSM